MDSLLIRLGGHVDFSVEERDAINGLRKVTRRVEARRDLVQAGGRETDIHFLVRGFACRYAMLEDGRRQVLAFLTPGDCCDLPMLFLDRREYSVAALGPSIFAVIPPDHVRELMDRYPRIQRALWWTQLVDDAIAREWITNLGQRSALERTAHLMCELHCRLAAAGLVRGDRFDLPVTQMELADALGLSAVHINRTVQELRRRELISMKGGAIIIHDLHGLRALALFNPSYLHQVAPSHEPFARTA